VHSSRELVRRQRRVAERLRREVGAVDGSSGHSYFRPLRRMKEFRRITDIETLLGVCRRAAITFVGDYHAVPAYPRFAATLLREIAGGAAPLGLGVEFVYTRQQSILDLRQQGRLDDAEFLRRVHYREEWGYPWEGYRDLLDAARRLGIEVFALDAPPRGGYDKATRRDDHAARRIASILQMLPELRLVVLFGESHLTSRHLPARVRSRLSAAGLERTQAVVFQNPDAIYWQLVSTAGAPTRPVQIDDATFAVFHTGPLEKYEAYRQVLERWAGDDPRDEEVDLTPAVHHLIATLLEWLGIDARRHRLHHRAGWAEELIDALPEVYSGAEATTLFGGILKERGRTDEEVREAGCQLARRGAFYEPRANTLFLTRYLPGPAAGEAARFLRAALTGRLFIPVDDFGDDPLARLYGAALNEALVHLGAMLVDPAYVPAPAGASVPADESSWIESHRRFERTRGLRPPNELAQVLGRSRDLRRALARDIGVRLGVRLFERVRRGSLGRRRLRNLFAQPLDADRVVARVLRLLRGQDPAARKRKAAPEGAA